MESSESKERERRRERWPSLLHACGTAAHQSVAEGPSKSEPLHRLRSRLGVCTSQLVVVPAVHTLLRPILHGIVRCVMPRGLRAAFAHFCTKANVSRGLCLSAGAMRQDTNRCTLTNKI